MKPLFFCPLPLLFLNHLALSEAKIVNQTIDDAAAEEITYSGNWRPGNSCQYCGARPNSAQTFNNTWHDSSVGTPNHSCGAIA
jgi:hypothetical protein